MGNLSLVFTDLRNWLFIKRVIRRERSSSKSQWNSLNLRANWYGRIYTVISLREEDMGDEEIVKKFRAMEKMRPINEYLASLGFTEIIFPSIEEIPASRSYLVVYSPVLDYLTVKWVRNTILVLLSIISASWIILSFI